MTHDDRIETLLDHWEARLREGEDLTAEELAADAPELTDGLRDRIAALRATQFLESGDDFDRDDRTHLTSLVSDVRKTELPDSSLSSDDLLQQLSDTELMSAKEVSRWLDDHPDPRLRADAKALAAQLIEDGKLTPYQATVLLQGQTEQLLIDKYLILDSLDAGGMGVVFKAIHRPMNRIVALKMLSPHLLNSPDKVQRFRREVQVAASLTHPNIVTAYDADESKGVHFLVMEYVQGSDLKKVVDSSGPLTVDQAVDCLTQAAHGLAYAHKKGVIHRDIKPSNLMLSADGVVKVLDLGLARMDEGFQLFEQEFSTHLTTFDCPEPPETREHLTHAGTLMGTVAFMAPEQAVDTHSVDHRADIYSLGCTLYYLLVGEPPYRGENPMQTVIEHREGPIPSLRRFRPDVPEELDAICRKLLAKKTDDRPQSMREVITALDALDSQPAVRRTTPQSSDVQPLHRSSADSDLTTILESGQSPKPTPSRTRRSLGLTATLCCLLLLWFAFEQLGPTRPPADVNETGVAVAPQGEEPPQTSIPDGEPGFAFDLEAPDAMGPIKFSPDGRYLCTGPRQGSSLDSRLRLYDVESRQMVQEVHDATFDHSFAFHPDGEHLVASVRDSELVVINIVSGDIVRSWPATTQHEQDQGAYLSTLWVSPDGQQVVADIRPSPENWQDSSTVIFDFQTGRRVMTLPDTDADAWHRRFGTANDWLLGTAGKRDGRHFGLALWDIRDGVLLRTFPAEDEQPTSACFSVDSKLVAALDESRIAIWDTETADRIQTINAHEGKVHHVRFLGDTTYLVSGGMEGSISIWDVASGLELFRIPTPGNGNRYLEISPDGHTVASHRRQTDRSGRRAQRTPDAGRNHCAAVLHSRCLNPASRRRSRSRTNCPTIPGQTNTHLPPGTCDC